MSNTPNDEFQFYLVSINLVPLLMPHAFYVVVQEGSSPLIGEPQGVLRLRGAATVMLVLFKSIDSYRPSFKVHSLFSV